MLRLREAIFTLAFFNSKKLFFIKFFFNLCVDVKDYGKKK